MLRLIREGGQRLALRRLLDTYGADVALSTSQMAQKRLALNLEVRQLEDRIRHLRTLQNQAERLPPTETLALVTGIGESTYLPLATQADAGEIELQGLREKIHRLDDQVLSDRVTSIFLERAAPKVRTLSQGLKSPLMPLLLPLIDALDREMAPTDRVAHARIARIRADLIEIHARYITQLPVLSKTLTPSRIRPVGLALSLLAGAVLGLLVALIRQTLRRIASTASH